jgi:hypothetical protein
MVWVARLENLLEVIDRLSCLALEVALSKGNVFLIRVVGLLVIVALIAASNNCNLLVAPLWPPLVAFGARLRAFAGCLEECPSTIVEDYLPLAIDENGIDYLLTRGVPGDDVEKLLCGLWLIMVELMH